MTGAVDLSSLKQRAQSGPSGGAASGGVDITEANFEAEVLVRSGQVPVVVLLWSPRSAVCVQLADALAALAVADAGRWALALVNVDAVPRVAAMFGVEAVPTVVALADGQPLSSFQGPQPPDQLRRWLDSLVAATANWLERTPVETRLPRIRYWSMPARKLDAGDFEAAAAAYRSILDADPAHAEAKAPTGTDHLPAARLTFTPPTPSLRPTPPRPISTPRSRGGPADPRPGHRRCVRSADGAGEGDVR